MKTPAFLATAALLLATSASAQQWDGDNYTFRLKGCYAAGPQVRCDFTYVLTGADTGEINTNARDYEVVTTTGETLQGSATSVGGQAFQTVSFGSQATAYRGAPVQVSVVFDVANVTSFRVLAVTKRPMNNVPVAKSAAALATAAKVSTTPPTVTTPTPNAGIPTGFSLTLSNCKVSAGVYTCTATLTPRR